MSYLTKALQAAARLESEQKRRDALGEEPGSSEADKGKSPSTLAEAVDNVQAVFPGTQQIPTRKVLSPEGWQKAFTLCPAGPDRERLIALWSTGAVSAESRDGVLHLLVTTPEGAVVTILAGESPATAAVLAAFQVDHAARYEESIQ